MYNTPIILLSFVVFGVVTKNRIFFYNSVSFVLILKTLIHPSSLMLVLSHQ